MSSPGLFYSSPPQFKLALKADQSSSLSVDWHIFLAAGGSCSKVTGKRCNQPANTWWSTLNLSSNASQHCPIINQRCREDIYFPRQPTNVSLFGLNATPTAQKVPFTNAQNPSIATIKIKNSQYVRCPRLPMAPHVASWANFDIAPTRGLASLGSSVTSTNPYKLAEEFPSPTPIRTGIITRHNLTPGASLRLLATSIAFKE